jgi:hypothetical protein
MAKSIDQQIKDAMAKKVVGRTTEIYKAVVLELYKRITANSLQVGIQYGSPVLTGRYYASHTIARGALTKPCASRARTGKRTPTALVTTSFTLVRSKLDLVYQTPA